MLNNEYLYHTWTEFDETRCVGIAEASTTCTCGNGIAWSWSEFLLILNVSLKLTETTLNRRLNRLVSLTHTFWNTTGIILRVNINCSIDIKYCNIINCLIGCLIWLLLNDIYWLIELEFPYSNGIKTPTLPAVKQKNSFIYELAEFVELVELDVYKCLNWFY